MPMLATTSILSSSSGHYGRDSKDDPLSAMLRPPPDEDPEARVIREEKERQSKSISDAIDEALRNERNDRKKKRVKLLLLGQSESGKSTTLRQFQRLYTPNAFREERSLWRSVIQLNLVRSIRIILDALSAVQQHQHHQLAIEEQQQQQQQQFQLLQQQQYQPETFLSLDAEGGADLDIIATPNAGVASTIGSGGGGYDPEDDYIPISAELELLKLRLAPLRHVEALLISKLAPPHESEPTRLHLHHNEVPDFDGGKGKSKSGSPSPSSSQVVFRHNGPHHSHQKDPEVFVRSGYSWKGHMASVQGKHYPASHSRPATADGTMIGVVDEVTEILHTSRQDMMMLWKDPAVKEILRRKKLRLEETPGFFLDQLERLTALDYEPSDDDVLRARLKTVGVSEYKFEMEAAGRESGHEWSIYDVGGTRSQRATWVPFFDDVDAIIFLAPISAFDQTLVEDRAVNRLEDSVLLWKSICSNKLLAKVDLILFLNKCDILSQKLRSGVRLARYVRSYGDRPNEWEAASQYFKTKFAAIQREYSPQPRRFYGYCTSVTDTITTSGILASVRDMIVREHLKQSRLI